MPEIQAQGGATLHYEEHGNGPPLLLIHGLGSGSYDWEPQIAHFASRYRVIVPDLRGHARSSRAPGPYSMKLFAADIAAVLEHARTGAAHVVGISLGGAIAFQLVVDRPDLVRSLVIVNSGPYLLQETFAQRFAVWSRFFLIRWVGLRKLGRVVVKKLFPEPGQEPLRQKFLEGFDRNDPEVYKASLRALVGWSVKEQLGAIRVPTLILSADQDYSPVEIKQQYVPLIPGAKLQVIPDSHHFVTMERPQAFNRALDEFLAPLE